MILNIEKDIPKPEKWEKKGKYFYKNKDTGREIIEESYLKKIRERNILAKYIDNIEPVKEEVIADFVRK